MPPDNTASIGKKFPLPIILIWRSSLPKKSRSWLRVLNLGGGDVDTSTPMGSMVFTVMAALAQMELDIKRERITDSVAKRRAAGKDLGGRLSNMHEGAPIF